MLDFSAFLEDYLIIPKLLYLTLNMAVYSTYVFTSNYFKNVWNIPIYNYGFIAGLTTAGFVGSILATILADRTGKHKLVLILTSIGYATSFCLLRLELFKNTDDWRKYAFVSVVYGIANCFVSALYPLLDNRIFVMLMQNPKFNTKLYGKQRLWGSVGQALITQINAFGIAGRLKYDIIFINVACTTLAFVLLVIVGIPSKMQIIPEESNDDSVEVQVSEKEPCIEKPVHEEKPVVPLDTTLASSSASTTVEGSSACRPIVELLKNLHFLVFLVLILCTGYVRGILGHFLTYYFEYTVRQNPVIYAVALQARLVSEILFFSIGKTLMARFGVFWVMLAGLLTGTIRVLGYAVIPVTLKWSYMAFVFELLKGINNACVIMAGVRMAHDMAPVGSEATAQGFFSGVHASLPNALSGIFGGIMLKMYEGDDKFLQKLFLNTAAISFTSLLMFMAKQLLWPFPTIDSK